MKLRRLNSELHRDIGYFLSGLIVVYCASGIALNHVDDWNPDFVIQRRTIALEKSYTHAEVTAERIAAFTALAGESEPRVYDFPTAGQVKLYYDNATLHVDLAGRSAVYERVQRRPLLYETNVLHRNSVKGWKWVSDVLAVLLIFLTFSGWCMLKGKHGLGGRGKWFIAAGVVPPAAAIVIFQWVQH